MDLENDVKCVFWENAWEDRRRIEMRMSRCFTKFHIGGLGEPHIGYVRLIGAGFLLVYDRSLATALATNRKC